MPGSKWRMFWGLPCNSNVLIAGKRLNSNRLWNLGDQCIKEAERISKGNFGRNLYDNVHVNEAIKAGNMLIGYIKSIIDGQDDFKRAYYRDHL